jgi:hypothetical protein
MLDAYTAFNDTLSAGAASPASDPGAADRVGEASRQARNLVEIARERRQRELHATDAASEAAVQTRRELDQLFLRFVQG